MVLIILFTVSGLILVTLGSMSYSDSMTIKQYYQVTNGEIVNFQKGQQKTSPTGYDDPTEDYYKDVLLLNISYTTDTGDQYWHKVEKRYGEEVGDKVEIYYNPDYPNQSIIYSNWTHEAKPILALVSGAFMLLTSIILLFLI